MKLNDSPDDVSLIDEEVDFPSALLNLLQDNNEKLHYILMTSRYRQLQTIQDFIRHLITELIRQKASFGQGTFDAQQDARFLVYGFLNLDIKDDSYLGCRLTDYEKDRLAKLFELRLKEKIPTAYILGFICYNNLNFYVTHDVIIPRSPIAFLLNNQKFVDYLCLPSDLKILDLCCGSGAIGISIVRNFIDNKIQFNLENLHLKMSDISPKALNVAKKNAEKLLEDNNLFSFNQGNIFEHISEKFDLIVCNPPYVDKEDYQHSPLEFKKEPKIALTGKGKNDDGLKLVYQILQESQYYLNQNGVLILETGNSRFNFPQNIQDNIIWIEQIIDTFEIESFCGESGIFVLFREDLDKILKLF